MSGPDIMAPDLMSRDLAVLEARIFERAGFAACAAVAGVTRQQAEWICRRLHPIPRDKRGG
jgi:hypothetical protein